MKNKIMENKMNTLIAALLACIMLFSSAASIPVHASGAGWFIGGVAASRIGHNMRERTQAEEQQAYYAQQQSSISLSSASQAPASQSLSPEARIQQLDKLAAGGYITPAEYKSKKEAIINGL